MRRDTQAVLLLLVGATLLKVAIAGTYVRYVKPAHLPLLVITGIVLVVVAGVALWRQLGEAARAKAQSAVEDEVEQVGLYGGVRAPSGAHRVVAGRDRAEAAGRAAAAHEGQDDGMAQDEDLEQEVEPAEAEPSGHQHENSRVGWLLLVPALALLLFSPPALGSFQANRNGTALSAASGSDFAALPPGDPVRITMLDYAARAVFDRGRSLSGRDVQLTGFVIAGARGTPYLARLVVGCCAADARPIKVGLTGDLPGILAPDQWVEVVGRFTEQTDRDPVNGEIIPYLHVVSVRDISAPNEPYET
jgi:uncharacterized repeat protein (TIGR03943 family)